MAVVTALNSSAGLPAPVAISLPRYPRIFTDAEFIVIEYQSLFPLVRYLPHSSPQYTLAPGHMWTGSDTSPAKENVTCTPPGCGHISQNNNNAQPRALLPDLRTHLRMQAHLHGRMYVSLCVRRPARRSSSGVVRRAQRYCETLRGSSLPTGLRGASWPVPERDRLHLPGPGGRANSPRDRPEQSFPASAGREFLPLGRQLPAPADEYSPQMIPQPGGNCQKFGGTSQPDNTAIARQAGVRAAWAESVGTPDAAAGSGTSRS